jgi:hypothetical protein
MKKNVGKTDKLIRLLVALAAIVLYYLEVVQGTTGYIVLGVGAIMLFTSIFSVCPLYMPFKINTNK